nr:histidinol-phosphatase [Lachnospiraceae bacterium]
MKEYPYLYETHLHTAIASACAKNTGREMAKAARDYGYTGIVVTDHNWGGNTCIDRSLPWTEWVDAFARGYYDAREMGDQIGLDVFWGYEAGYDGTEFLIFGTSPEWMRSHPELRDATIREQFDIVHKGGGIVVHAHPYREEYYIPKIRLFPEYVDGVEAINATHSCHKSKSHNDPKFDERAIAYAREHGFPMT